MGDFNSLLAATVLFVGSHFLLTSHPLRAVMMGKFGKAFLGIEALIYTASFVWMLFAYGDAPYYELWAQAGWMRIVPAVLMPVAFVLVVAGLTTKSPTNVGAEDLAKETNPAPGILRITRHPFLWGTTLWALSHLLVNGDVGSVIMMGGILILSVGGMVHIDSRRERSLGADWGPMKLTTSLVPFAALLSGRTKMDWKGLSWWRPLLGLVLYMGFMHGHEMLIGVSAVPH
ncbi:NnrU family protein [Rhodovibrionaceae bacterium A322]